MNCAGGWPVSEQRTGFGMECSTLLAGYRDTFIQNFFFIPGNRIPFLFFFSIFFDAAVIFTGRSLMGAWLVLPFSALVPGIWHARFARMRWEGRCAPNVIGLGTLALEPLERAAFILRDSNANGCKQVAGVLQWQAGRAIRLN